ncbi:uncharacterized protein ACNS7B_018142 [Menidia menidia]
MPNPPPDQPEWIKALISAPPGESSPAEPRKTPPPQGPIGAPPPQGSAGPPPPDPAPPGPPAQNPRPKHDVTKVAKVLNLLGRRSADKPPPGRSTGIISFIGPNFGHIEREDLQKFTFNFDVFFGNPKAMTPGVRVHFTACKEKDRFVATDVKVAPGGTENVDLEVYEAVVSQPILEPQPGERQYPGQVLVTVGPVRTNLPFERRDSGVSLLRGDQVLITLLRDVVTQRRRATGIRPQVPLTFSHTKEARQQGVIVSLGEGEGVIRSEEHGELPFEVRENFSDVEFTAEDVGEEVEFTVATLRAGKRAIRIQRVKEPLLLALFGAGEGAEPEASGEDDGLRKKPLPKLELGPNTYLDQELYEGIVSQPIIEPKPGMPGYPGQIHANIGPIKTNVTFDHRDCGVTLLKNDHVLINLLVDTVTQRRRAANIKPKIPFTFSYTKETREMGVITELGAEQGVIRSEEHGEISFDTNENFSDTEFRAEDLNKEVEFTMTLVKSNKRAIRLRRLKKKKEDKVLQEQKKKKEEEQNKEEDQEAERRRGEERNGREEEEERRKKEEVAAALAAAKDKWTPLGFKISVPHSMDDISKERFEGTVLKAVSRNPWKEVKEARQEAYGQVKIKEEKVDEEELMEGAGELKEVKKEEEEPGGAELGRLVMTVDGQQRQLPFSRRDLLTMATMLDGDKVRFNIATHRETKAERATYVEILPDSFEESTEQRRHGIVIEFSEDSGLIKCSQNPQLFFHMSEVIEKKKLELNEKVEFSVVPHETAEGGSQAIRIKRFTEKVFLPVRKLGGVGTGRGKMTIKLTKPAEEQKEKPEADKMKAVVKHLRKDCGRRKHEGSRSRSRSPARDQFGRILKRRRSESRSRSRSRDRSLNRDRDRSRDRDKSRDRDRSQDRDRNRDKDRSQDRDRNRDRDRSQDRDRSRDRDRSKDRDKIRDRDRSKKRSKTSREKEDGRRRRRDLSPSPRRGAVVDTELARKKRELEELNEMIAYKKSLVDLDPRGLQPGQRTCIDYDHGRIAMPLAEYKPVRSILKKQPGDPEYHLLPPYDEPYYERHYARQRYGDPYAYAGLGYGDRPYSNQAYSDRPYGEPLYSMLPSGRRYTDRYDVYDEPYEDRCSPPPQPGMAPAALAPPSLATPQLTHTGAASSSQPSSSMDQPPESASPPRRTATPRHSPPAEKPPLDRFLDMLNRKVEAERKAETKAEPAGAADDLLPHERALQDGNGFSRILGLAPQAFKEDLKEDSQPNPEPSPLGQEELKAEPYQKIQNLLRTIGLKLSSGEVSKLAGRAQDKVHSPRPSSTDGEIFPSARAVLRGGRTGSVELDSVHSPSPVRSSSLEPAGDRRAAVSEYEDFLDQQELEALKKVRTQTQTHTGAIPPTAAPRPPWGTQTQASTSDSVGPSSSSTASPPQQRLGPPPGPPPQHPGPSPQHPGPSPQHPGPSPQHPGPSPQHRGPSPQHRGPSPQHPGPSPQHPGPSPQHPGPSPQHPGPSPQHPGPPPQHPGPSPQHPGPPPQHPGPPPQHPGPSPQHRGPSPQHRGPSPQHPGPSPQHRRPSPQHRGPSPQHPGPSPQHPGPSPQPPGGNPVFSPGPSHSVLPFMGPLDAVLAPNSDISTTVARCLKVIQTVKSLSAQPPAKPLKSVQFSLPAEASSGTTLPITGDPEEEAKEKEKLDLSNQRLLEKTEQQKKKDGPLASPGKPLGRDPRTVWIFGHSLVSWAELRAKAPEGGPPLGMDPARVGLWWRGHRGLTWPQMLPQVQQLGAWPRPHMLILHLGGNDLSTGSPTSLLAAVRRDLAALRLLFPKTLLVWSSILPRRNWNHSADSQEVDLVRCTVNRRVQSIVAELGGAALSHDNIRCGASTGLYRADGVHLSPRGIDLFNLNLQEFLEKWQSEEEA